MVLALRERESWDVRVEMEWWYWCWLFALVIMVEGGGHSDDGGGGGEVTYDGRSLIIDGQRKLLFSGSIHYPRSTPEMWPSLIAKGKEGGLDVIQTYVFWNLHEPQPGQYEFSGRNDVVRFMKEIHAQGLYACLRIGPFIESEWTYGGFPFWLHDIPGIIFRSDNEPFKFYMQNFTTKIVDLMKSEGLYASQGGPIILSQIENEYGNIEAAFKEKGPSYVRWAAKMAVELQTGVPWVMCKQIDAPDPVINTCNGMRCGETFGGPNSPNKPSLWTENWTSFYQVYGEKPYIRSAEDIAFHVALFIAKNGSYINYYMYHGGTNFGRTGSSYVITSYYDQAPLDEYGLLRQPKWGHLKELHAAIKLCSTTLLQGVGTNFSLGQYQEAYVFREETGGCVAFLTNHDGHNVTVQFQNASFELLPKSISILPDCKNVIFNTAKVNTENNNRVIQPTQLFDSTDNWEEFKDVIPNIEDTTSLKSNTFLEHMNTTKDKSDYLWYTLRFEHNLSCTKPVLHVESFGHVAHAFLNNMYIGAAHGSHNVKGFMMDIPIMLNDGINNISIVSVMVGLPDSGAFLESKFAGLTKVEIQCMEEDQFYNLTNYAWGYQVGLLGEKLHIFREESLDEVVWSRNEIPINHTFTWYKIFFDAPMGDEPVALNLSTMGKGEAWVNGESIGRYWVSFLDPQSNNPSQTMPHSRLLDDQRCLLVCSWRLTMSSSISTPPSAPTSNLSFFSFNLHHPLPPFTHSFSISFPMPNPSPTATLRLALCRAAKPQTGPPKKPPVSKRKKKSKGGCSGSEALNISDVEVVRELGVVGNDDDDVVEYLGSDARSLPHQPMPLPKPPAGFVVDNHGRVVMASAAAKRIATIVDPMNNLPLECVVRRVFRSSKGDECMLLCPVDTPVQILKSTNMDGWSAVIDEEVESILPSAAYALAKIHMHLVHSGFCYTARGGFCYSEDNLFDFRTDNGQDVDGLPTEGVEITCFHLDGAHYMIYTPSDPLLFVVVKNHNGVLQIADDDLLEDPAIISSIDEETEFNALVEEEAALLESLKLGEK